MSSYDKLELKPEIVIRNDIVVKVNKLFLELSEYTEEELLLKDLFELNKLLRSDFMFETDELDANKVDYIFTKSYKPEYVKISYHRIVSKNEIVITLKKLPFITNQGLSEKQHLIVSEVTKKVLIRRKFEEKTELIKKLEGLSSLHDEYFSYMAHEFKTPLTITYSAIQLLDYLCKDEISDRAKGFINKIRQSTLQQLRLVNNIMDISKADSGFLKLNRNNYDIVLLTKVIVNSVSSITKGKGIDIIFTSSESVKYVFIDDEKFERILLNILSNAIKFTQGGKSIYVDLNIDDKINIKVRDEGIGIPQDKCKIIFDKFGQVNNSLIKNTEGTGIGLCLAKILANALGGDITFESEEGKGSEFTIQLPLLSVSNSKKDKIINEPIEDRLIQSINLEFSNIYL